MGLFNRESGNRGGFLRLGSYVLLVFSSGIGSGFADEANSEVAQRAADLRIQLKRASSGLKNDAADALTIKALVDIVRQESGTGGDDEVKGRALRELGRFPNSELAVATLVREIEFKPPRIWNSDPLWSYDAASALARMGSTARHAILNSLGKPLAEHELHLRALVLAKLDDHLHERETGQTVALYRLKVELENRSKDPEVAGEKERKAATLYNLKRMIAILEKPSLTAREIPHPEDDSMP